MSKYWHSTLKRFANPDVDLPFRYSTSNLRSTMNSLYYRKHGHPVHGRFRASPRPIQDHFRAAVQGQFTAGSGLVHGRFRASSRPVQAQGQFRAGSGLVQGRFRASSRSVQSQFTAGSGQVHFSTGYSPVNSQWTAQWNQLSTGIQKIKFRCISLGTEYERWIFILNNIVISVLYLLRLIIMTGMAAWVAIAFDLQTNRKSFLISEHS